MTDQELIIKGKKFCSSRQGDCTDADIEQQRRERLRNYYFKHTGDDPKVVFGRNWESKLEQLSEHYDLANDE